MLSKLELKIRKEPSLSIGALIWNSIPLFVKTLNKNQFKSKLKDKLLEILKNEDDYTRISDIRVQFLNS